MINEKNKSPMKLIGISGFENRTNDIIYGEPTISNEKTKIIVYFGGDIQNFEECMKTHRDNKNYIKWSLENTSLILQNAFPESHIIVVRPSKMELKTFSCFENFVPSGNCGVPSHIPMHNSIEHLNLLIKNVAIQLNKSFDDLSIAMIGFSKGCVVLNQFLYEFYTLKEKNDFISRIRDIFWLDGGHSGGKNTWITSKPLLEVLASFGINIHIHVSPYQIMDERRPWIKKEEKIFYNTLVNLKASVKRKVHSENLPPSIIQHFCILNEFFKASDV